MAAQEAGPPLGGRGEAWWDDLREAFLARLRETGNVQASARGLAPPHVFYNRRRSQPGFRRDWDEAVAAVDSALKTADSAFPAPAPPAPPLPEEGDLGAYLRPGRKRPRTHPEPVIRRNSRGRAQVTFAAEGHWTSQIEADFLARLGATGNFDRCARAVGFHPSSIVYRMQQWPAFARACDEALQEAATRLDYKLVAHAHALLRRPDEPGEEDEEDDIPFDPKTAMQILGFIDARRAGRTGRGRRKGPPERSFDEAVESVLAKIDAIERHRALKRKQASPPSEGGD